MIRLNCFIKTTEEHRNALTEIAIRLVEHSKKERGCVAYDLYADVRDPLSLLICETWEDSEALSAHQSTETFHNLAPKLRLYGKVETQKFEF